MELPGGVLRRSQIILLVDIHLRFRMIEMQTILIELLESFEFSPAPGVEIRRAPAGLMTPM